MQLLSLDTHTCETCEIEAFGGHPVFCGERCVGVITSGAYGARVGKSLALAWLSEPASAFDQPLSAELLGQRIAVAILDKPPFDPQNHRMKT